MRTFQAGKWSLISRQMLLHIPATPLEPLTPRNNTFSQQLLCLLLVAASSFIIHATRPQSKHQWGKEKRAGEMCNDLYIYFPHIHRWPLYRCSIKLNRIDWTRWLVDLVPSALTSFRNGLKTIMMIIIINNKRTKQNQQKGEGPVVWNKDWGCQSATMKRRLQKSNRLL